ncbi:MAG: hypothetical protein ACE5I3_10500 [Phycisphaerae bacterium]
MAPAVVLLSLLGAGCVGCDGTSGIKTGGIKPLPPRDAREAMQRINDNLAKIDGALYCPGYTSFRFRDANGRDRRFIAHPATVIFEAPRALYYDIKSSLGGGVARIGSNNEHYWLWVDTPEARKLWHGTWEALEREYARRMAVPPNQLLDALMMRSLPEQMPGVSKPLLRLNGNDHRLVFLGLDAAGWPYAKRELKLDPKPPYMPLEIIDRLRDGRVVMHAYLKGYKPVKGTGPDGPYTARKYVVYWELDGAEMRLDLRDVRYRTKDAPFWDFPDAWEGEVESLDEPPALEASGTVQEGADPL